MKILEISIELDSVKESEQKKAGNKSSHVLPLSFHPIQPS
jgi:hypothetical protein